MKRVILAALTLAGIGLVFAAGSWVGWRSALRVRPAGEPAVVLYYACPMHPQYHAEKAGDCPSCGMRLEPVRADGRSATTVGWPAATLTVSPDKQQLIGVRTVVTELSPVNRTIRTVGRVEVDADRVYRVTAAVDGVVRELHPNSAGRFVEQEEVLLTFFSTEFLGAQQAFLYALNTRDRIAAAVKEPTEQSSLTGAQLRAAVDTLRNMGMSDSQIAELGTRRKAARDVELRSPVTGYVLSRTVFPKQRLEPGMELYRIADLGRLWVLADLFEADAAYVRPGTTALLTYQSQAGGAVRAQISNVLPQFDPATRTMKVRLEIDNKDMALRPDMIVNVEIAASLPTAVTVPIDALVDSGTRTLVFVDRGNGHFEPRRVSTGWRADDRVEIVRGLTPGERIVVSGNFLLDSESRMKLAGTDAPPDSMTDPVCGMSVDRDRAMAAGLTAMHDGEPLLFCSPQCKKAFEADPSKYVAVRSAAPPAGRPANRVAAPRARSKPAIELPDYLRRGDEDLNPPALAARGRTIFATDPVCGAEVDTTSRETVTSEYRGKRYYFFSSDCKAEFDRDPAKYAK